MTRVAKGVTWNDSIVGALAESIGTSAWDAARILCHWISGPRRRQGIDNKLYMDMPESSLWEELSVPMTASRFEDCVRVCVPEQWLILDNLKPDDLLARMCTDGAAMFVEAWREMGYWSTVGADLVQALGVYCGEALWVSHAAQKVEKIPAKKSVEVKPAPGTDAVFGITLKAHHILLVRRNGVAVWTGNSGRHGNKGIAGTVRPDEEMPKIKDKDGNMVPIDVLLGPTGVGGRTNPGQIYETLMGKVAAQDGTPIMVDNFPLDEKKRMVKVGGHYRTYHTKEGEKQVWIAPYEYDRNVWAHVQKALEEAGLEDTESVYYPDGSEKKLLVGYQYMLKLGHQAEKGQQARGEGYPYEYTMDRLPGGGSGTLGVGHAQSVDPGKMYALLAHGALHNVTDSLSLRSDRDNDRFWEALQSGEPLPGPQETFTSKKFRAYLEALGLNLTREGNEMRIVPLTDEEILKKSNGEITKATVFSAKTGESKDGELFDGKITGGLSGTGWGHCRLVEPIPNPLFIKPIAALLGMSEKDVLAVSFGEKSIDGKTGSDVINGRLAAIEVDKELAVTKEKMKTARGDTLDKLNKKAKYLNVLDDLDVGAESVYMLKHVPVIPPVFRPVIPTDSGEIYDDLNLLYSQLIMTNRSLEGFIKDVPGAKTANIEEYRKLKRGTYDAVAAIYGTGPVVAGKRDAAGILHTLHGKSSVKYGFVHRKMLRRRQDISGRAVIAPDPALHFDDVGVPRHMLMEMYSPFLVRRLGLAGIAPLDAKKMLSEEPDSATVDTALKAELADRPLWLTRDPVLHKFGLMAFREALH